MAAFSSMCSKKTMQILRLLQRSTINCDINCESRLLCRQGIFRGSNAVLAGTQCYSKNHNAPARNVGVCFISAGAGTSLTGDCLAKVDRCTIPYHTRCELGFKQRLYSTQHSASSSSNASSLTDDILKSKIGQTQSTVDEKELKSKKSDKNEEKEKKDGWFSSKNAWKLGLLSIAGMSVIVCGNLLFVWGAPLKDPEGHEIRDEYSDLPDWKAYPKRFLKEANFFKNMIQEPSSQKLLPDPLKEPYYQPPYTLVLEMTGVLVHPDWTFETGWRFKKRPGIDYFLNQLAPLFEIVIYTHEQGFTAFPIIDSLDPNQCISYRLFRDATRYTNGLHVKDLACLNRDLSKVIIVDCDPKAFQLHPRNAFGLPKWKGRDSDRTLVDLANFLRTLAISGVEDVRMVLDHYSQFDDPLETFKENQRKLQEEQSQTARVKAEEDKRKSVMSSWSMGLTGRRR